MNILIFTYSIYKFEYDLSDKRISILLNLTKSRDWNEIILHLYKYNIFNIYIKYNYLYKYIIIFYVTYFELFVILLRHQGLIP